MTRTDDVRRKEAQETQETNFYLVPSACSCGQLNGLIYNGRKEAQEAQKAGASSVPSVPPCGNIFSLCDVVRETAFAVHKWFRHGHLEKVYENALANRLSKAGLGVRQQFPLPVFDEDGTRVGDYFADLLVDGRLIVELKACRTLADEHIAQILGYLRASKMEHGLLINFGAPKLQVKKLVFGRKEAPETQVSQFEPFAPFRGKDRTE